LADKKRVLIVEDEAHIARLEAKFAQKAGYEARVATDGMEAMNVIRGWTPDIILADVMMPRLDGYRLCRMLKFDQRWKAIPVIHVTAKGGAEAQALSREVGAEGMLRKPFTMEEMLQTLGKYLTPTSDEEPQPAGQHSGEN
jgi:twitching motility two-component system response regulator PilG